RRLAIRLRNDIDSSPPRSKISLCISHLTRDQHTQRTPGSKSTRRLVIAVQAKRSPGIGGRLAQGSGERQRRGTKSRHCPEPVRPKTLENRPTGKRQQSGRNTDADGTVDGQCRRLKVPWNALCQQPHARQMLEREGQ